MHETGLDRSIDAVEAFCYGRQPTEWQGLQGFCIGLASSGKRSSCKTADVAAQKGRHAMEKPLVGVPLRSDVSTDGRALEHLLDATRRSLQRAGAFVVPIAPVQDIDYHLTPNASWPALTEAEKADIDRALSLVDGLFIPGGYKFCQYDRYLLERAVACEMPVLAVCMGMQIMSCYGEDEVSFAPVPDESLHCNRRDTYAHKVRIAPGSRLREIVGADEIAVNSWHKRCVSSNATFETVAWSEDGLIEAMELPGARFCLGVQWHPECMEDGLPLFRWLIKEAADYRAACNMHHRILTLDTHCDTPMFFPQGIDFGTRDERILVDLHKMTEGHQDATIMVAYLPQPQMGETFSSKVQFDVDGPTAYADLIFDKIEDLVEQNSNYLSIARTPADLMVDKRQGRKSIMLGIENGLALDGKLQNLNHFAQRGIVYMTLCHNGDNDICDSARGCNTHNGLSSFGKQVVRDMNKLGIIVDMSHAAEKSFFDTLDLSEQPIVCSHSSSRALCDHPRNLTDDQMRALAAKGGVAQTTVYHGFLRKDSEATILDAIAHLEHAIKVMGIDHVGLGTDFDGDGGVRGLADSSELINFTRQLLARRYSERDIQKIW